MAQTKHQIQALLTEVGIEPRHRFGQNFMIDQNLVRLVAAAGELRPEDRVIEVGPGTGTLTEELLASGAEVIAVEIDRDLAAMLREKFADRPRFRLIEGDALAGKHAINDELKSAIDAARAEGRWVKLVANLPYNIASPLVIDLLLAGVDLLAFTVQKEVADRLRGGPETDSYGPISVMGQLLSRIEVMRSLPPQAFWPAPKVESALVRMRRDDRLGSNAAAFSVFVQTIFSARRKTLRRALVQGGYDAQAILAGQEDHAKRRPEEFTPEQLQGLFARTLERGST